MLPEVLLVANNRTMLLPCHHTQTDLDINVTSKLLRQFNSATEIAFNGGKKQETVFHCG